MPSQPRWEHGQYLCHHWALKLQSPEVRVNSSVASLWIHKKEFNTNTRNGFKKNAKHDYKSSNYSSLSLSHKIKCGIAYSCITIRTKIYTLQLCEAKSSFWLTWKIIIVHEILGVMSFKWPCHTGEGCIFLCDTVTVRGDTHRWYNCFSAIVDHPGERRHGLKFDWAWS